ELFTVLLDARYELVAALASGPESGVDPVRRLFLHTWERLRDVVRRAARQGRLGDRALRYVAFVAAGESLAAGGQAGPARGVEIPADGLRRLARILEPDFAGDPLEYSDAPDSKLRELFDFHEPPASGEPPPPPHAGWWPGAMAWAFEEFAGGASG